MLLRMLVFPLILVSTSAFAATPAADGAAAKPPTEKKICRAAVNTGSIIPARTCHTKAEWAQIDRDDAANAGRQIDEHDRGLTGPGGTAGVGG